LELCCETSSEPYAAPLVHTATGKIGISYKTMLPKGKRKERHEKM